MRAQPPVRRVLVMGTEGSAVGRTVRGLRSPGVLVAGYVGDDEQTARHMAEEMLGGVDELREATGSPG
ncbi:MAG: hypothetical protein M3378_04300 [Actinomycetota bacterium]|nr:hypothetical protein [Actinomycetota bacterium]